jgi:hypothetical protein
MSKMGRTYRTVKRTIKKAYNKVRKVFWVISFFLGALITVACAYFLVKKDDIKNITKRNKKTKKQNKRIIKDNEKIIKDNNEFLADNKPNSNTD